MKSQPVFAKSRSVSEHNKWRWSKNPTEALERLLAVAAPNKVAAVLAVGRNGEADHIELMGVLGGLDRLDVGPREGALLLRAARDADTPFACKQLRDVISPQGHEYVTAEREANQRGRR